MSHDGDANSLCCYLRSLSTFMLSRPMTQKESSGIGTGDSRNGKPAVSGSDSRLRTSLLSGDSDISRSGAGEPGTNEVRDAVD
jgi:hypothetical protein